MHALLHVGSACVIFVATIIRCKAGSEVLDKLRLEDYVEVCSHVSLERYLSSLLFLVPLMTFNNHFSISYLRNTLSFCRWCLRHLLFDQSVKR